MEKAEKTKFVDRFSAFIVDRRSLFFLLYALAVLFSLFSANWVQVNNDITSYLDESTETRQSLTIMDEEFITYATADIMVSNITYAQGETLAADIADIEGVSSVSFDNTESHYTAASALFSVTFTGQDEDEISMSALEEIKDLLAAYDVYIDSDVGNSLTEIVASEMSVVLIVAAVVIVAVLLLTSQTYGEVPVLILTFGAAVLLNRGTNFWLGEISFVSDSVTIVLQLALSIDYAIILCHRFFEEREQYDARDACVRALSSSIMEIFSSSLTTICGLAALIFMQFHLGADLGLILIKSIFFSLLTVFTLTPGLLMLFSSVMDRTHHRSFVPRISFWGRAMVKLRYVVPPLFVIVLIGAFLLSSHCPYAFGYSNLSTLRQNENQIAEEKITETFGDPNIIAILVPAGDYAAEGALLDSIEAYDFVDYTLGLANIQVTDNYRLTDELTPRQFSELTGIDISQARLLYTAYIIQDENYSDLLQSLDSYAVPLLDMFQYAYELNQSGYFTLEGNMGDMLEDYYVQITDAKNQLQGETYSRLLVSTTLPEEDEETYAFLDTLHTMAEDYYDPDMVYLAGDSTSCRDLAVAFETDNTLITILTIIFVLVILLFSFKSAGLPVLLILVIEGSIWINFSFPYLMGNSMFFLGYLIVSSIQMGANIDYAIVISSRYLELKKEMPYKEAMVETLNLAFPTILTSGLIMASAGILISLLTTECTIYSIGVCVGRGTLISMILVMGVLPEILLLGDTIIEKTSFTMKISVRRTQSVSGRVYVNGHVRGHINGVVDAQMHGIVIGDINAVLAAGKTEKLDDIPPLDSQAITEEKTNPVKNEEETAEAQKDETEAKEETSHE